MFIHGLGTVQQGDVDFYRLRHPPRASPPLACSTHCDWHMAENQRRAAAAFAGLERVRRVWSASSRSRSNWKWGYICVPPAAAASSATTPTPPGVTSRSPPLTSSLSGPSFTGGRNNKTTRSAPLAGAVLHAGAGASASSLNRKCAPAPRPAPPRAASFQRLFQRPALGCGQRAHGAERPQTLRMFQHVRRALVELAAQLGPALLILYSLSPLFLGASRRLPVAVSSSGRSWRPASAARGNRSTAAFPPRWRPCSRRPASSRSST